MESYTIIQSKFNRTQNFETDSDAIKALKEICNRPSDLCYVVKTKDIIFPKKE